LLQAFGFLSQYRELVGPGQEVEYNFGRAFHQIGKRLASLPLAHAFTLLTNCVYSAGLNAYAVKHYEQCLACAVADRLAATTLSDDMAVDAAAGDEDGGEEKEYDDYAKAAAYNLTTLYVFVGQPEKAKAVADRWLAV
jgi:general transcription factor 3C polypeptide 3 (transcription factor C subunit 4)